MKTRSSTTGSGSWMRVGFSSPEEPRSGKLFFRMVIRDRMWNTQLSPLIEEDFKQFYLLSQNLTSPP